MPKGIKTANALMLRVDVFQGRPQQHELPWKWFAVAYRKSAVVVVTGKKPLTADLIGPFNDAETPYKAIKLDNPNVVGVMIVPFQLLVGDLRKNAETLIAQHAKKPEPN